MQARDVFGLAIRLGALVFMGFSLYGAFWVVAKALGLELPTTRPLSTIVAAMIFFAGIAVAGLLGADRLVIFSYGKAKSD
jgi:hypothetical protein